MFYIMCFTYLALILTSYLLQNWLKTSHAFSLLIPFTVKFRTRTPWRWLVYSWWSLHTGVSSYHTFPHTRTPYRITTVSLVSIGIDALWHFHLGHVSDRCLDVIKSKFPLVKNNESYICDVAICLSRKSYPFLLVILFLLSVLI